MLFALCHRGWLCALGFSRDSTWPARLGRKRQDLSKSTSSSFSRFSITLTFVGIFHPKCYMAAAGKQTQVHTIAADCKIETAFIGFNLG